MRKAQDQGNFICIEQAVMHVVVKLIFFCERRKRGKAVVTINASSVHVGPIQDDGLHVGLDFEKKRRYPQQIARKNL